jgi:hypothetical protein
MSIDFSLVYFSSRVDTAPRLCSNESIGLNASEL